MIRAARWHDTSSRAASASCPASELPLVWNAFDSVGARPGLRTGAALRAGGCTAGRSSEE